MGRRIFLMMMLSALGCTSETEQTVRIESPGYLQIHENLITSSCAVAACHGGESGGGGLSLSSPEVAYAALVGMPPANGAAAAAGFERVMPGHLDRSFLWWKLTATPAEIGANAYGASMPLGAFDAPGPTTLAAIKAWIEAGAPMDGSDFVADWASEVGDADYVECEAIDEAGLRECFGPPPEPTVAMRVYTPPLTLSPGTEHVICSRLDVSLEGDLVFKQASGKQMLGGHHAAVYVSMAPEDGFDPINCDDIDMGAMRFVTGAGGAGGQDLTLPDGVGLRIREGEQLIIQSHYINTSTEERVVMDVVDLVLSPPASNPIIADAFSVVHSDFLIPPGAEAFETVKDCVVDRDINIHLLLGHTHDYGVLFEFELLRSGEAPRMLYHATDGPMLRDTPEIVYYDPPLGLQKDDRVRMTCHWNNLTGHDLTWPEEMCVAFMYYSPGQGFLICDSEDQSPVRLGGDSSAGCAGESDVGNALGVGRYCTADGGECAGQTANFCIAAFSEENYCTVILCDDDSACGEGASCVAEGPGSACVPTHCQ